MLWTVLLLTFLGFALGSLPFSVWVGKFGLKRDIQTVGDHNPGATNVLRSGGTSWFILALILDISKGAVTVGIAAQLLGITDWTLVPIAMAPPLGHAFSPFLNWQGGKAIAATFGVWIGLTIWTIPLVALVLLTCVYLLQKNAGWAVMLTLSGMLLTLMLLQNPVSQILILLLQMGLLGYTHRHDLARKPELRQMKWLFGSKNS